MTPPVLITHDTPIGTLTLTASQAGLTRATLQTVRDPAEPTATASPIAREWLDLARRELDDYFAGTLRDFTVPVDLSRLDPRRRRVLEALGTVGYGQRTTYGALSTAVGLGNGSARPLDARQVGGVLASNPVLIIVGCHRVVGSTGSLVGYAGGVAAKCRLLDLESRDRAPQLDLAWA